MPTHRSNDAQTPVYAAFGYVLGWVRVERTRNGRLHMAAADEPVVIDPTADAGAKASPSDQGISELAQRVSDALNGDTAPREDAKASNGAPVLPPAPERGVGRSLSVKDAAKVIRKSKELAATRKGRPGPTPAPVPPSAPRRAPLALIKRTKGKGKLKYATGTGTKKTKQSRRWGLSKVLPLLGLGRAGGDGGGGGDDDPSSSSDDEDDDGKDAGGGGNEDDEDEEKEEEEEEEEEKEKNDEPGAGSGSDTEDAVDHYFKRFFLRLRHSIHDSTEMSDVARRNAIKITEMDTGEIGHTTDLDAAALQRATKDALVSTAPAPVALSKFVRRVMLRKRNGKGRCELGHYAEQAKACGDHKLGEWMYTTEHEADLRPSTETFDAIRGTDVFGISLVRSMVRWYLACGDEDFFHEEMRLHQARMQRDRAAWKHQKRLTAPDRRRPDVHSEFAGKLTAGAKKILADETARSRPMGLAPALPAEVPSAASVIDALRKAALAAYVPQRPALSAPPRRLTAAAPPDVVRANQGISTALDDVIASDNALIDKRVAAYAAEVERLVGAQTSAIRKATDAALKDLQRQHASGLYPSARSIYAAASQAHADTVEDIKARLRAIEGQLAQIGAELNEHPGQERHAELKTASDNLQGSMDELLRLKITAEAEQNAAQVELGVFDDKGAMAKEARLNVYNRAIEDAERRIRDGLVQWAETTEFDALFMAASQSPTTLARTEYAALEAPSRWVCEV